MATTQGTIDFLLDQLSSLAGIRTRKMFGEYAIYHDEKVVGLVCDNQLFVKITPEGKALVGDRYEEGEAYPGAKPSMLVSADDLEDSDRLVELIRVTSAGVAAPKPRTPRKKTPAEPSGSRKNEQPCGSSDEGSTLTRPEQPMLASVRDALVQGGLMEAYQARPAYQRNDYLGWINRAKRQDTKDGRIQQMLEELARGDRYMKMPWSETRKRR